MKAMRYHNYGGPEELREDEVDSPKPSDDQVLIRVTASSVNPADWSIGEGAFKQFLDFPRPFIPGLDFSGVIIGVGGSVDDLHVGDRVYGTTGLDAIGTFAEEVAVRASSVALAPKSIPLATAGVVPVVGLATWTALTAADHGNLQAGQRVLIHGASGGTGSFAVQFARALGAHVIATASSKNVDYVRSLGAQEVIDYTTEQFEKQVDTVDVVLDLIGGDVQNRSMPLIRKGGVLVSIVSLPDQAAAEQQGIRATFMRGHPDRGMLQRIAQLIDEGAVKVNVSEEYPMWKAAEAMARGRQGHNRGKIMLRVRDDG